MNDLEKYDLLKQEGATPVEMWRQAEADGLDQLARIRLIRKMYGLTLVEAKAVLVQAQTGQTLNDRQQDLAEDLEKALRSESEE